MFRPLLTVALIAAATQLLAQENRSKPYRLPSVELKQPVIWGAEATSPDGFALSFGGQDQDADDGRPHTRIKVDDQWTSLAEQLNQQLDRKQSQRLQALEAARREIASQLAAARRAYFQGHLATDQLAQQRKQIAQNLARFATADSNSHLTAARNALDEAADDAVSQLRALWQTQIHVEQAAEAIRPEPPPRALSPIVYEPVSKRFVVFGGDHCDYLLNDLWVFDPQTKRWEQRHPKQAPPPRANHQLTATGDGTITVTGGYTYSSSTGYVSGQYVDLGDGPWTYDLAKNQWTGEGKLVAADQRVYRTGPFHPKFYYPQPPDPAAHAKWLADLPVNTWTKLNPPHLPRLNRDWGSAVIDPDRDLILRFSGGHSAHGGTDVLQYHLATNRWELCFPVEFPLGQLYSNTSYPRGFNFNLRPWVTGHTYQNYGYDTVTQRMLFTGEPTHYFTYDPTLGDWTGRAAKPKGMVYNSCFYTLTLTTTPKGMICWTKDGNLFRFEQGEWQALETSGDKLAGAVVDNSTIVHDTKRDRLLAVTKPYGKAPFGGSVYAVDLKTLRVTRMEPAGRERASVIPYLCQLRYDPQHDLLLVGGTYQEDGQRRTPAYDCASDRWVSMALVGDDPSGEKGRNVSLGLMYDAKRKLFWAVDTNSQVYVLRIDPAQGDLRPL